MLQHMLGIDKICYEKMLCWRLLKNFYENNWLNTNDIWRWFCVLARTREREREWARESEIWKEEEWRKLENDGEEVGESEIEKDRVKKKKKRGEEREKEM